MDGAQMERRMPGQSRMNAGMASGPLTAAVRDTSPIEGQVQRAHGLLNELEECVAMLGVRLEPVSSSRPENVSEKPATPLIGSMVGRELVSINARIETAVVQLRRLGAQLEV